MVGARLKAVARQVVPRVAPALDVVPSLRRRFRAGLHVFTFHDVGDDPSPFQAANGLCTPTAVFRRQLDWISERFLVIDPALLADADAAIPDGAAVVTFDDGWAGIFEVALPELARRRLPSIVFVTMASIEGEPDLTAAATWCAERDGRGLVWPTPASLSLVDVASLATDPAFARFQGRFADVDDVGRWGATEGVSIGSHLYRHWNVAGLDAAALRDEVAANADALRDVPGTAPLFAFPFGKRGHHFSEAQAELVLGLGAARVFSSDPLANPLPVGRVVDRVSLTGAQASPSSLWWTVHQSGVRRLLGRPASG